MMRLILLFLFTMILGISFSQQEEKNQIIQQRVEFISEELENEEIDLTDVTEVLLYRIDHPVNLNSASWEDLQELFLLSDLQINDLFAHREAYGKFISIYELQSLKYWDMKTINIVLPFVKVDDKLDQLHVTLKEALKEGKFEAFLRYQRVPENKDGYTDVPDSIIQNSNSYYYGNPDRYYTRLRFKYRNNLSVGMTAEKDPGEQFFRGAQKNGFDFYSAHAFYKGGKYLRAVALGDYQIQIGQGLNLWSSFAFQKTADATNVKRSANPLRPYTSVDETRFFRGAAVDVGLGDFSLMLFGSSKGVDGNVVTDSLLDEIEFASSINLTGFHRTNSEIERKDGLQEHIGGANLRYSKRSLQLGVAAVYQGYDRDLIRDTLPYNQFDFRGRNTTGISADYSWVFRNFNFFGETSYSTHSKSWANLHGVLFSLDTRVAMSMIYRNYQRGYHSFYNAGFAEGSRTQNEKGLYTGIKINFSRAFSVNGYVDVFKFPWLRYQVDAPSDGHEWLIQPSYKPNRSFEVYFRFREQVRPRNSRDSDGTITTVEDVQQRNYRLNLSYKVTESVRLKSRIEYVTINRLSNEPESGFVVSQDIIYKPKSSPFSFAARYALFDTDSFDSRIYTFENNALYVFSAPAYFYQGSRAYLLVRYKFLRRFDLWARYGTSIFANRASIGSGAEEVVGNTRSDITIQLRMQF
ncbi:MAG: ComEA family DNA-binding protein [Crocinitomicaceae bacterium]